MDKLSLIRPDPNISTLIIHISNAAFFREDYAVKRKSASKPKTATKYVLISSTKVIMSSISRSAYTVMVHTSGLEALPNMLCSRSTTIVLVLLRRVRTLKVIRILEWRN